MESELEKDDVFQYVRTPSFWWLAIFMAFSFSAFIIQTPLSSSEPSSSMEGDTWKKDAKEEEQEKDRDGKRGEKMITDSKKKSKNSEFPTRQDISREKVADRDISMTTATSNNETSSSSFDQKLENDVTNNGTNDKQKEEEEEEYDTRVNPRYTLHLHGYLDSSIFAFLMQVGYVVLFFLLAWETYWVVITVYRAFLFVVTRWPHPTVNLSLPANLLWAALVQSASIAAAAMGLLLALALCVLCVLTCWYPLGCLLEIQAFDPEVAKALRERGEQKQKKKMKMIEERKIALMKRDKESREKEQEQEQNPQ